MSGEPRYETAFDLGQRIGHTDSVVCADCGVFVMDRSAHTRSHSIMNAQAWALAVLKTAHIAAHVHDRYEAYDKINSRKFDSWSAEAFAEVAAALPDGEPQDAEPC